MAEYSEKEYIKLNRKILTWEWYSDPCTRDLFIHCLLKANWKEGSWHGIAYKRGEFITSISSLAQELNFSMQNIRTALRHLKLTGELTDRKEGKSRVITVVKYNEYQVANKVANRIVTSCQQDENEVSCDKIQKSKSDLTRQLTRCETPGSSLNTGFNEGIDDCANKVANRIVTSCQQDANNLLTTDKEVKEVKEVKKKNNIYSVDFESFWKCYPRHVGKAKAYRNYQTRIKEGYRIDDLKQAAENYAAACARNKTEEKFIQHAATFLGPDRPLDDYLETVENTAVCEKVKLEGGRKLE